MITQALKINKVAFHFTAVFVVFRSNLKFLEQNTKIKVLFYENWRAHGTSMTMLRVKHVIIFNNKTKEKFYFPTIKRVGLSTERNILPVHG